MSPVPEASAQSQTWLRLLIVGGLLWFGFLGVRPLFNPDEGRYADAGHPPMGSPSPQRIGLP